MTGRVGPVTKSLTLMMLGLFLAGCNQNPYSNMSETEIHAKARAMPLKERYSFYLAILHSSIPENPNVADDLVLLGEPARKYVIEQALGGDREDLLNALPALAAFDGCTPEDSQRLIRKARLVARDQKDLSLINTHALVACEVKAPPGYNLEYDELR